MILSQRTGGRMRVALILSLRNSCTRKIKCPLPILTSFSRSGAIMQALPAARRHSPITRICIQLLIPRLLATYLGRVLNSSTLARFPRTTFPPGWGMSTRFGSAIHPCFFGTSFRTAISMGSSITCRFKNTTRKIATGIMISCPVIGLGDRRYVLLFNLDI